MERDDMKIILILIGISLMVSLDAYRRYMVCEGINRGVDEIYANEIEILSEEKRRYEGLEEDEDVRPDEMAMEGDLIRKEDIVIEAEELPQYLENLEKRIEYLERKKSRERRKNILNRIYFIEEAGGGRLPLMIYMTVQGVVSTLVFLGLFIWRICSGWPLGEERIMLISGIMVLLSLAGLLGL